MIPSRYDLHDDQRHTFPVNWSDCIPVNGGINEIFMINREKCLDIIKDYT